MPSDDDAREPEQARQPIDQRAHEAIRQIMAGGDLSEITLALSNGYTDEKVADLKRALKKRDR